MRGSLLVKISASSALHSCVFPSFQTQGYWKLLVATSLM